MPKAHQQYFADEVTLEKEARTFQLDDELKQKIDDIDTRAQENVIEIVKENGVPLPVDANKAVDVTVPLVQDSLDSTDPSKSLSARQGKILYDYIVALQSRGRFLSNWNADTGTPVTAPFGQGYTYNPGDYYIVTVVSNGGTNLRPEGTVYTGAQSTTPETEQLDVSDIYVFDGTQWLLQKNTSRVIAIDQSLSTTSTNPVENRVITNALNSKQDILTAGANIQINSNVISATGYSNLPAAQGGTDDTLVTTGDKYNWNNKQDELQAGANIQIDGNVISATDTTYGNFPEAQGGTTSTLVTTGDKYNWNHKQDGLTAGANIQINGGVISATDTTYSAGNGITIDNNNVISADGSTWGHIGGDINNQTDLINLLDGKQNVLTAGDNIQINNDVISATDTTYSAGSGININAYNEIVNERQFDPDNVGLEGQVLKRNSTGGYSWEDESGGGADCNTKTFYISSTSDLYTAQEAYDFWRGGDDALIGYDGKIYVFSANHLTLPQPYLKFVAPQPYGTNWQSRGVSQIGFDYLDLFIDTSTDTVIAVAEEPHQLNPASSSYLSADTGLPLQAYMPTEDYNPTSKKYVDDLLATKQNILIPGSNITIDPNTNEISAVDTTYTAGQNITITNNVISASVNGALIYRGNVSTSSALPSSGQQVGDTYFVEDADAMYAWDGNQWNQVGGTGINLNNYFNKITDSSDNIIQGSTNLFVNQNEKNRWNDKQDKIIAGNNITIDADGKTINAIDTTYTAGNGISISNNTITNDAPFQPGNGTVGQVLKKTAGGYAWQDESGGGGGASISNAPFGPNWDGVGTTAPSKNAVYDKIAAMDITIAGKQNLLTAGTNIQINGDVISATDTKYTASDFDIKDLADSLNLRNLWSNKQDIIVDLNNIRTGASKGMTALQPGDNVSRLVNDAGYITKAVNDLTNYYNKNQTYTKTEVDALIANFAGFEVVSTLPTHDIKTTVIYLLGPSANNTYEEYIYTNNQWVKIGETTVDLTNYFHKVNDDSDDIIEGSTHLFMTPAERLNLSHQSGTNTGDETQASILSKLGAATVNKSGYLTSIDWNTFNNKQDKLVAGNNIQINGNVISATGGTYTAGSYISINGNNVISNIKPFIPGNDGATGQVLTKTDNGYSWQNGGGGGGGGGVTSVNGRTGAVTVKEFDPDNDGEVGQILRKISGGYQWSNESGGGGGGGGVTSVNGRTGAVTVKEVSSGGSRGQVLTKTANGYDWDDIELPSGDNNVKFWTVNTAQGMYDRAVTQEIYEWLQASVNNGAIINDTAHNDVFIFYKFDSLDNAVFYGNKRISRAANSGTYTTQYQYELDIYPASAQYGVIVRENPDDDTHTNYISADPVGYQGAFWPINPEQPASRAYVDSVASGSTQVPVITNNMTGTQYYVTQEWAGTQAQYDALVNSNQIQNGVIYNIIPSS